MSLEQAEQEYYEKQADDLVDKYLVEHAHLKDEVEIWEKRLIIKELALASRKREIVRKLNAFRRERELPELNAKFDLHYYQTQFAPLIESLALHYAQHIAKRFRFANRIARIGKLNDVAEGILSRIQERETDFISGRLEPHEESAHRANVQLFARMLTAIDDSMGKLTIAPIDKQLSKGSASDTSPEAIKSVVEKAISEKFRAQLPAAVEANFSEYTDYDACEFGEKLGGITHCWYHNEQCHVQSEKITSCPKFINKTLMHNRAYLSSRYIDDKLSVRKIAEIAGCKEVDGIVETRVRNRLKQYDLNKRSGDSGRSN